jgi:DNA topoisomerase-1
LPDTLLIVESPAKARAIGKYLGKGYTVKASMGHIRDLPGNKISVDVEAGFLPHFDVPATKKAVVKELQAAAAKSKNILLAADPDREGEAICYHLHELLKEAEKPIGRVLFNEITPAAVKEAVEHPGEVDSHKVSAQIARRIIDRLVGYRISPLLWKKVRKGLSAGRVQTAALRMVREREKEILDFIREEYWVVSAALEGEAKKPFEARLTHMAGKKAQVRSADENAALRSTLEGKPWSVAAVDKKRQKRSPLPPFTTSKLQQEAARLLKFPVKKTMGVAQRLYEGVDLAGGETVGLITYMRTDSTRLNPQAVDACRAFVGKDFGEEYVPKAPRTYAPGKKAQDAHEAIRPTDVLRTPDSVKPFLGRDEFALYRLIWRRFVACQMADALFDNTRAQVACADAIFLATGSVCVFPGFRAAYEVEEDEEKGALPPLREAEALSLLELKSEQKFTEPPPRYSEATLVKALEENGIGRPSTYATIISTIQEREYVHKEAGTLNPTDLGILVCDILIQHFPTLFDLGYTAGMETELDKVEEGGEDRQELLNRFWSSFVKELDHAEGSMVDLRREGQATQEVCEACGKPMVLKMGRFGRFYACTGYPECKSTKPIEDEGLPEVPQEHKVCTKCGSAMAIRRGKWGPYLACEKYPDCKTTVKIRKGKDGTVVVAKDEVLEAKCPQCQSNLVKKQSRYGPFVACSNYPTCKYVQKETVQLPCPKCGKPVAKRFSKNRKAFYGCTGYPECDFVSWEKPVEGTCPKCASPFLVERRKGEETAVGCPVKGCGWVKEKEA